MTGRERFLCVLNKGEPDRLPVQVHGWMKYYLDTYLNGMDQYDAYEYFQADLSIYSGPIFTYDKMDYGNWQRTTTDNRSDGSKNHISVTTIVTPEGALSESFESNQFTTWNTEHIIKNERDFEIWRKYMPRPIGVDWTPVKKALDRIGDRGMVRSGLIAFGQYSPWQSFCTLFGAEKAIMACYDRPDWVHYALKSILVVENGADGLETMTPPSMGGDCDLAEAYRRVAGKLFLIGGFDQNAGFEKGRPETVRKMVYALHESCPRGGYIVSPSDHFFSGNPGNIRAFFDAAKECGYKAGKREFA